MIHGNTIGGKMTGEYQSWRAMIQRCTNPKNNRFSRYGGRGITVCERWQKFSQFLADMGPKPTPQHSIERINGGGNYEPLNCKWATRVEQMNNRSNNRYLTLNGVTKNLTQWALERGLSYATIRLRLQRGLTADEALVSGDFRTKEKL